MKEGGPSPSLPKHPASASGNSTIARALAGIPKCNPFLKVIEFLKFLKVRSTRLAVS
jgi:hypothetical protein